jgi:hypothetical protein
MTRSFQPTTERETINPGVVASRRMLIELALPTAPGAQRDVPMPKWRTSRFIPDSDTASPAHHPGVLKWVNSTSLGVWADPLRIGYQTYAYIEILVDPPEVEKVARTLADFPEIVFVGVCTGSFDIHVAVLFTSNEHMYELITKRLNNVKGVLRTSTSTVMRIVKRDLEYPVPGATIS